MSAALAASPEDHDLRDRLDQLIPPSTGSGRKLAISSLLVAMAVGVTFLNIGGRLYPRPTFGSSFGSSVVMEANRDRGIVATSVMLPNNTQRAIRITRVSFDAPGAELVEVGVLLEDLGDGTFSSATDGNHSGSQPATTIPMDGSRFDAAAALPFTVQPGEMAQLILWFRPTSCTDQPGPWGIAEATVDFGDGAFPPISRTIRIDQDPVAEVGEPTSVLTGGEMVSAPGPLAAACEALR